MKCENCLNTRSIISENGLHSVCCLTESEAMECLLGKKEHMVGPVITNINKNDTKEEIK